MTATQLPSHKVWASVNPQSCVCFPSHHTLWPAVIIPKADCELRGFCLLCQSFGQSNGETAGWLRRRVSQLAHHPATSSPSFCPQTARCSPYFSSAVTRAGDRDHVCHGSLWCAVVGNVAPAAHLGTVPFPAEDPPRHAVPQHGLFLQPFDPDSLNSSFKNKNIK